MIAGAGDPRGWQLNWLSLQRRRLLVTALMFAAVRPACSEEELGPPTPATPATPDWRLIFVGDAGKLGAQDPALSDQIQRDSLAGRTTVVWLGDNVYEAGLFPDDSALEPCGPKDASQRRLREEGKAALRWQVAASQRASQVLFIPGNHDWSGKECGYRRLAAQRQFLQSIKGVADVRFVPDGGCPGPAKIDLPSIRLILYDSQWLIHPSSQGIEGCAESLGLHPPTGEAEVRQAFLGRLAELIGSRGDRSVILAAHHPLRSHGTHGGHSRPYYWLFPGTAYGWWGWLIPLPGAYALRPLVSHGQDLSSRHYKEMVLDLDRVLQGGGVLAHVAGHEHSLQLLRADSKGIYQIVSGSAAKLTPVGKASDTDFRCSTKGYVRLDVLRSPEAEKNPGAPCLRMDVMAAPSSTGWRPIFSKFLTVDGTSSEAACAGHAQPVAQEAGRCE